MEQTTQQKKETLAIQSSVKLTDGTFVTLTYNPYLELIVQEARTFDGVIVSGLMCPLKNFSTDAPIKEVTPRGFVRLENKLLAIARATVSQLHDHALFFHVVDPVSANFICNFARTNGEIKEISMQTCAGELSASLFLQNGAEMIEFSVPFRHSWEIDLTRPSVIKRGTLITLDSSK